MKIHRSQLQNKFYNRVDSINCTILSILKNKSITNGENCLIDYIVNRFRYTVAVHSEYTTFKDYFILKLEYDEDDKVIEKSFKFPISNYGFRQFKITLYKEFEWIS